MGVNDNKRERAWMQNSIHTAGALLLANRKSSGRVIRVQI